MQNPNFSSGPCSKRPAWSLDALKNAAVGRSHRSALGKERLVKAINETKKLLTIPADYLVGIMPASDTGAFECAMWSLLGSKPVTVLVWESFSDGWATDVAKQLKLNPKILKADYGKLPDLKSVDWTNDVVFVANGTTSGVKIPDWNWIPASREGLVALRCNERCFRHGNRLEQNRCFNFFLAEMSGRRSRSRYACFESQSRRSSGSL